MFLLVVFRSCWRQAHLSWRFVKLILFFMNGHVILPTLFTTPPMISPPKHSPGSNFYHHTWWDHTWLWMPGTGVLATRSLWDRYECPSIESCVGTYRKYAPYVLPHLLVWWVQKLLDGDWHMNHRDLLRGCLMVKYERASTVATLTDCEVDTERAIEILCSLLYLAHRGIVSCKRAPLVTRVRASRLNSISQSTNWIF
jgi:hypothetical protein